MGNQNGLFDDDEIIARKIILAEQKKYYETTFLGIVNELTNEFNEENPSVLKINSMALRLERASGKICVAVFSTANKMKIESDELQYLRFAYNRFESLFEEFGDEETGKIDWNKVKEVKGKQFIKSFPLKDSILAAKMVAAGELEL